MLNQASAEVDPAQRAIAEEAVLLIVNDAVKFPQTESKIAGKPEALGRLREHDDSSLAEARLQIILEAQKSGSEDQDDSFEAAWNDAHGSSKIPGLEGYGSDDDVDEHQLMARAFEVSVILNNLTNYSY